MMVQRKALFLVYDGMSLSEVTLLADFLKVFQPCEDAWEIDTVGSRDKRMVTSEESFQIVPNKSFDEILFSDYEVIVLTGNINPYTIAEDKELISFLSRLVDVDKRPLIAAISSAPMFLAKSGVLEGVRFTSGLFEETLDAFNFFEKENIVRKPVVYDKEHHIVTGIGFAYREFAVKVAELLGYDDAARRLSGVRVDREYTPEELTFYMNPPTDTSL